MERFSISFLCQQVYSICRLCGVDNPEKIPIIGAEDVIFVAESDEPTLVCKIEQCVGIKVDLNDKMPQNICSLCVDKVNDFYEYRLMCEATNIQTRRFLNLPMVMPTTSLPKAEPVNVAMVTLDDEDSDVKPNNKRGPKTRNRKKQSDPEARNSEESDSKSFLEAPNEKRAKYEYPCPYCHESFSHSTDLERHRVVKHTPLVHKFGCGSCMEYFDTATEYKDHNLWHKLTRKPFGCFRCGKKCVKISTLNKHVSLNACIRRPRDEYEVTLVPDMQCTLCHKVFKTRNLYEWHGCFMRARADCPRCGKHFLKKNLLIRHYMLFCSGTIPLLDPIIMPKDEPGSESVNGVPSDVGTVVKKRGRKPKIRATESMKEETIDLPLPPMLDLPDVKSETNSIPDAHMMSEGTSSGPEMGENHKRSSLIKETDKITTLLRSGESVDGNTDLNTISSMLSSVNEAIATISKVRKKKKKRDRLFSSGAGTAGEQVADKSNPPMVILSRANVKHEVHANSNMLTTLVTDVENRSNESVPVNDDHQEAEGAESDHGADDYDDAGDNFAHHNDGGDDSDSDVEIISVEQYQPANSGTAFAINNTRSHETENATEPTQPFGIQVKQEPTFPQHDEESDFEGYEDASLFVAVKQEPMEDTDETAAPVEEQYSAKEKHTELTLSSYQALRIKIKKEKGLLNASVVGEDGKEPGSTDPIPTHEENAEEVSNRRETHADVRTKTPTKTSVKRNNSNPLPVKQCLLTTTSALSVTIKQELMENDEQVQERVTHLEQHCTPEATVFDTTNSTVQIKQEPQEDDESANSTDVVAFDGRRIKRERPDDDPVTHKRLATNNDLLKKALNPLSLSGVRIAAGKKSSNSQSNVSAHKTGVMINPFALLKKKESAPTVAEQQSGSKDSIDSSAGRSERFALPVITQVKSIDPVEHLSLSSVDTVAAELTDEVEQQRPEATEENSDDTGNLSHKDSSPPSEPLSSEPRAERASNPSSQRNIDDLKIASVTTIPEDIIVPPQQNASELQIASVATIPEDRVPGCQGNEPHKEVQTSGTSADNNDSDAISADVSELTKSEDPTPQRTLNDVDTSCRPVVKENIVALDSNLDDEKRIVDEQKTLNNEEEKQEVAVVPESSEDVATVSMDDEQQEPDSHDTQTVDTTGSIESSVKNVLRIEGEMDVNVNTVTSTESQQEESPTDESLTEEVHADTQREFCAVANNDEILVAKQ